MIRSLSNHSIDEVLDVIQILAPDRHDLSRILNEP